jgi:hypothetical protein
MLKIYLDNCCYNRPFDDLTIGSNGTEATAKMFIQSLIKYEPPRRKRANKFAVAKWRGIL